MRYHISPVVNGMETDRFAVNRQIETAQPSAIMLSHVCDIKDVKNAIRSAGYIVNDFGLRTFKLIIYGSLDVRRRAPRRIDGLPPHAAATPPRLVASRTTPR